MTNNKIRLSLINKISKISKFNNNCDQHSECSICLTEFIDNKRVKSLIKCKHTFHTRCINVWLMKQDTCPMCRERVLLNSNPQRTEFNPDRLTHILLLPRPTTDRVSDTDTQMATVSVTTIQPVVVEDQQPTPTAESLKRQKNRIDTIAHELRVLRALMN
jgi:hypothetical protein